MIPSQNILRQMRIRRGMIFGVIILTALLAFEIFNYSTTEYALSDLLGDMDFASLRWATILAIAFCGIDFAGIARLFTPTQESGSAQNESWYLFGAWLLAATMNAMLTWWGVSLAVLGHQTLGNEVVSRDTMLRVVPVFVSVLVWLIRVLIIGTFSVAGDRLFIQVGERPMDMVRPLSRQQALQPATSPRTPVLRPSNSGSVMRSAAKPPASAATEVFSNSRPEPTYHTVSASPTQTGGSANAPRSGAVRPGAPMRR